MRVKLTKTKAEQLRVARARLGVSQYELADEFGWVRSKIKRLEKCEVQSIEKDDLERLEKRLGVKESGGPRVEVKVKKTRSSKSGNVVPLFDGRKTFESVQFLPGRTNGNNCAFFRVKMARQVDVDTLMGTPLELAGYSGKVHGIENMVGQDPLRPGDVTVIMLWARNIQDQRPKARKKSNA